MKKKTTITIEVEEGSGPMVPIEITEAMAEVHADLLKLSSVTPDISLHGDRGKIYRVVGRTEVDAEVGR